MRITRVKKLGDKDSFLYVATKREVTGHAFLTHLDWDSRIFGFKIGRLGNIYMDMDEPDKYRFLNRIVRDCRRGRYRHIHCRIPMKDSGVLRVLENVGFNIADIQVTLSTGNSLKKAACPVPPRSIVIDRAGRKDLPCLKKLVKGIFTDTRFVTDPGYPGDKVDRMYYEWVKNSVLNPARSVFVARKRRSGELAAFGICVVCPDGQRHAGRRIGCIDLIAVKKKYRNRGIGKALLGYCLGRFKDNCDRVEIRTQVFNTAAIRTFMKSGFRELTAGEVLPAGVSMHLWL